MKSPEPATSFRDSLQIGLQHVADALASQPILPETQDAATPDTPLDPVADQTEMKSPEHAPASEAPDGSWQISQSHLTDGPAAQFIFPESEDAATPGTPPDSLAVETGIESPEDALASNPPPLSLVRADVAVEGNPWRLVVVSIALAASFAVAVVIPAILLFENRTGATALDNPPVAAREVPRPLSSAPANPIAPAIPLSTVRDQPSVAKTAADGANATKKTANRSAPAKEAPGQASANAKSADQAKTANEGAVRAPSVIDAGAQKGPAKETQVQANAATEEGNQATASTESAVQAAVAAYAAAQLIEAQQAADRAKAAKEAADQANAAKEAASQAQATALRARIAKDAADRVNAAMQVAARAKAQAEAAREAANRERRRFKNSLFGVNE